MFIPTSPNREPPSMYDDLIKSSMISQPTSFGPQNSKSRAFRSRFTARQQSLTTFLAGFLACHVVVVVFILHNPRPPSVAMFIKGIILFVLRLRGRLRRMTDFINKWRNNDARRNDERSNFHLRTFMLFNLTSTHNSFRLPPLSSSVVVSVVNLCI